SSSSAFLTRINPAGAGAADLIYSTFLGGTAGETGIALAAADASNVYVTGGTTSADFPVTAGVAQGAYAGAGNENVYVAKLDTTGVSSVAVATATCDGGGNDAVTVANTFTVGQRISVSGLTAGVA